MATNRINAMVQYRKQFELESEDHPGPYEAAMEMAEDLGGNWRVFEDYASGKIIVVTVGEE